ncbi:MAG: stage II sporulation protein M [Clostridia bacterium]|nr:stage II sporulation protein M [Clostridia bacterium]
MKTTMFNLHSITQKIRRYEFNWLMYLLIFLFFAGLILGSFSVKNTDNFLIEKIVDIYSEYLKQKHTFSPMLVFMNTFLFALSAVVICFFVGLCAVGIPFIAAVPSITGCFIGIISGYIYESHLLKGLGYCAIIIFPSAAIACVSMLFSCKESMLMSKNMLSLLANGRVQEQNRFKSYCIKYLIYAGICALAALLEAVLFYLFSDLFIF